MKKIITGLVLASMISSTVFGTSISAKETEVEEIQTEELEIQEAQNEKVEVEESAELTQEEQEVEVDEQALEDTKAVEEVKALYAVPADWAFTEESKPLHDAILGKYPTIDTNGDGYISVNEANSYTGDRISWNGVVDGSILTGSIDGIEHFTNITTLLRLSDNNLTGEIPENIGNISGLVSLEVQNNKLRGSLPASIGNMTNLARLDLANNEFNGTIPTEISNTKIGSLNLVYNKFSGEFPASIANLTTLRSINITNNNFSGSFPDLSNLPLLTSLQIGNNSFTGLFPTWIYQTNLEVIALSGNDLKGELTSEISNLVNLKQFEIAETNIGGNTGEVLKNNTNLKVLDVRKTPSTQTKPDNIVLNIYLRDLLSQTGDLIQGLSSADIDQLLEDVEKLNDNSAYWKPVKDKVKAEITQAYEVLQNHQNAENLVNNLVDDQGIIKDTETQDDIDNAKDVVSKLPEGPVKDELNDKLNDIQDQYNEKEAEKLVGDLVDENGNIKDDVTQDTIDDVKNAVEKLPEGPKKDELKDKLDDIQDQLDEKSASFAILTQFETYTGQLSISARIDAPSARVSKVYLNGVVLDPSLYSITEGSTIVTLNKHVLSVLPNGDYTVTVEYIAGKTVNLPLTINVAKVIENPTGGEVTNTNDKIRTGVSVNMNMLYSLALVSLGTMLFVVAKKKKFNK